MVLSDSGLEMVVSAHSFVETLEKLVSLISARGLTLFARIDFASDARKAGLQMPPAQLLIFGNPNAGTPIMLAAPSSALDLPLKVLVSQNDKGQTVLTFNAPEYVVERHAIPPELLPNIAGIRALVKRAAAQNP
jgi:uncharacterized protein (DUF302 family)